MGLSESALKPFNCLSHCKVSCDSPCCVKTCGEDNHCNFNTDTHEHVNSDSGEEHIERKQHLLRNILYKVGNNNNNDFVFCLGGADGGASGGAGGEISKMTLET